MLCRRVAAGDVLMPIEGCQSHGIRHAHRYGATVIVRLNLTNLPLTDARNGHSLAAPPASLARRAAWRLAGLDCGRRSDNTPAIAVASARSREQAAARRAVEAPARHASRTARSSPQRSRRGLYLVSLHRPATQPTPPRCIVVVGSRTRLKRLKSLLALVISKKLIRRRSSLAQGSPGRHSEI